MGVRLDQPTRHRSNSAHFGVVREVQKEVIDREEKTNMSDETNKSIPTPMGQERENLATNILWVEQQLAELDARQFELLLLGEPDLRSKVLEVHHAVSERLATMRQAMMATEPAALVADPAPPAPVPLSDAQLHPQSDIPRGEILDHKEGTDR
jgi:hypothetical protein